MRLGGKDIFWSYAAQGLDVLSGLIILPAILSLFTSSELGFYYIMLSVGALVSLIDFGFSPQFSRNITYVYSGARGFLKEGLSASAYQNQEIDYHLLSTLLSTAKMVYRRLALIALLVLLSLGSAYVYYISGGFKSIENSVAIWVIYCFSVFFAIYFAYYNSLLVGSGKVAASRKASVVANSSKILLSYLVLLKGGGLFGIVIVNLCTPFISRFIQHRYFYTKDLKSKIKDFVPSRAEVLTCFKTLWFNAKRGGILNLAIFFARQSPILIIGALLPLSASASFGLMRQIFNAIGSVSSTALHSFLPQLTYFLTKNQKEDFVKRYSFCNFIFYSIYLSSAAIVLLFGDRILELIGSNSTLPQKSFLCLFAVLCLMENNFWNFCQVPMMQNKIPFVKDIIISTLVFFTLSAIFVYLSQSFWGILAAACLSQVSYLYWIWPYRVLRGFEISLKNMIFVGYKELRRFVWKH